MPRINIAKLTENYSLWLAILLHLLLLLSITTVFMHQQPLFHDKPALYIPSYVYHSAQTAVTETSVTKATVKNNQAKPLTPNNQQAPDAVPLQQQNTASAMTESVSQSKQVVTTSAQGLHLIGDKKVVKPLIKILAKSLAAHLVYPRIALDFGLKGISYIGFVIHPDGTVTDVELVKSSGVAVLDKAALAGVNAMSPVGKVDSFLHAPTFLTVGIIFGGW